MGAGIGPARIQFYNYDRPTVAGNNYHVHHDKAIPTGWTTSDQKYEQYHRPATLHGRHYRKSSDLIFVSLAYNLTWVS